MRALALVALLAFAPCARAFDAQALAQPPSEDDGITVHGMAGGLVSLTGDAGTKVEPWAWIAVNAPIADSEMAPHLIVNAALSALPGETLEVRDPQTYRALEFSVGASQPISRRVHFDLYAEAGFATRLNGETTPRDRTARWVSGGIRFRSQRGFMALGIGGDQRLTGAYTPAVTISGAVTLWQSAQLKGAKMALIGSAVLGIQAPAYGYAPPRDVVRIGVCVGL